MVHTHEPSSKDLRSLREWLQKTPYLPQDIEDHVLATFVRSCKGSLHKAKKVMDNYYYNRIKCPELFSNLDPCLIRHQNFLDISMEVPLPKTSPDGSTVFFGALLDHDYERFSIVEYFKFIIEMLTFRILNNEHGCGKVIFISDWNGVSMKHLRGLTPAMLTTIAEALETALPVRVQGMHGINVPPYADWAYTLLKMLVKPKIANRIYLHRTSAGLLHHFPKEMIPQEYGGDAQPLAVLHGKYRSRIEGARKMFLEQEDKLKKLDKLRPKHRTEEDTIGTFRQLNVD